jgi:hypothetical protein
MLRTLHTHNILTNHPIGVVNWTNEEGARFPISMVSSGVWAGEIPLSHAHKLKEVGGGRATMESELMRIGYLGHVECGFEKGVKLAAHFELHIEQGPILEAEKRKIGIVQGVQAYKCEKPPSLSPSPSSYSVTQKDTDVMIVSRVHCDSQRRRLPHGHHIPFSPRRRPPHRFKNDPLLPPRRNTSLCPLLHWNPHSFPWLHKHRSRTRDLFPRHPQPF